MSAPAEPAFQVPLLEAMRRAGLDGSMAEIRLDGDTLRLVGERSGALAIRAGEVDRIRIAAFRGRRGPPLHETKIWRAGERTPLLIVASPHHPGSYGPVIRRFAGWVFAEGGQVQRGPGLLSVIVQMGFTVGSTGLLTLLLLGGAIVERSFWMWLVVLFFAGLTVLLFVGLRRSYWPRRVSSPEELDEFLPPREEER